MDLAYLRPLYERPGPWTSVYLDASRDTPDAAKAVGLRWEGLRHALDGADPRDLSAIGEAIEADRGSPGAHGLALFANGGEIVLAEDLPAPPARDHACHGILPHAMPLAVAHGEEVSWLRVVVDRTGASISEVSAGTGPRHTTVEGGETFPITKSKPGGLSAPRYQRAVEETWDRNAGDVAEAVTDLAGRIGAEVVVLAGDPQARHRCKESLPTAVRDRVVETDVGSRAPGADPRALDEATERALAEHAAAHHVAVTDRFRRDGGSHGVTGLAEVVRALAEAKVETLLLEDDPSSTDELWIGGAPTQLAATARELRSEGVSEPEKVRADSAILRALAMTDADLLTVEGGEVAMADGIGAVLRYR